MPSEITVLALFFTVSNFSRNVKHSYYEPVSFSEDEKKSQKVMPHKKRKSNAFQTQTLYKCKIFVCHRIFNINKFM